MHLTPSDQRADVPPATSTSAVGMYQVGSLVAAIAGVSLALACVIFAFSSSPLTPRGGSYEQEDTPNGPPKVELFKGWPAELDLALVLSGQQQGYHQPC